MKGRNDREQLILAIYLTTRGFGFVVFEGRQRTIDWGVKDARGDKNGKVLAKIEELMAWYKPGLLVLEHAYAPTSRRTGRIRRLAKDFEASIASAKAWLLIASVQLLVRRVAWV